MTDEQTTPSAEQQPEHDLELERAQYQEKIDALEAELAQARAQLAGRGGASSAATSADEQTVPQRDDSPAGGFSFELVPTGRTHSVGGVEQPITDDAGEPEAEWVFYANADGVKVPLLTKRASFVENERIRQQRLAERDQSSS